MLVFYGIIFIGAFSQAWGYDYSFTLRNFSYVWDVGYKTIKDTVTVALLSTPISGIMGMFIAFLVVRKSFLGKGAMEFTSMLSFALPGTVVGIGYILAFNQKPLKRCYGGTNLGWIERKKTQHRIPTYFLQSS